MFWFVFVFFFEHAKLKKGKGGKIQRHISLFVVIHLIHYVCVGLILNLPFNSRKISVSVNL